MKKIITLTLIFILTLKIQAQVTNYELGDIVSDFTVIDTNGDTFNLYSYTSMGKYVWIDFFSASCGHCQDLAPIFNEFYDKYGCNSGDVICIKINPVNNNNEVIDFENTYGGNTHHAPAVSNEGGGADVVNDFGINIIPTVCLIGPDAKLLISKIDPISSIVNLEKTFPEDFKPSPMSCSSFIEDRKSNFSIKIYPNPASEKCFINLDYNNNKHYKVKLIDILEKNILRTVEMSKSGNIELSLKGIKTGLYIIQLFVDDIFVEARKIQVIK